MRPTSAHRCTLCRHKKTTKIFVSRNQHGRHLLDARDTFTVYSCPACEGIFLGGIEINADYYKKYYQQGYYENSHSSLLGNGIDLLSRYVVGKKQKSMLSYFRKEEKVKILDVGCGTGDFLLRLDDQKFEKSGLEINPEAVAKCRKNGLNIYAKNLLELDVGEETFDIITLWHVLEHVPNPVEILHKIRSLLAANGILMLEVPNTDSWGYRYGKADWFHLDSPRHLILYNQKSVRKLCELTGYTICEIKSEMVDYPLDLFWSVRKSPIRYVVYPFYPIAKWLSRETLLFVCRPKENPVRP